MTNFETAIFAWIADRCQDPALEAQLRSASVSSWEHTGVGCYSEIMVAVAAPPTQADYGRSGPLSGPGFERHALKYGGGSLLWFENGFAKTLEIHTYDDPFPEDHDLLRPVGL